jgi:hypothetical protein
MVREQMRARVVHVHRQRGHMNDLGGRATTATVRVDRARRPSPAAPSATTAASNSAARSRGQIAATGRAMPALIEA